MLKPIARTALAAAVAGVAMLAAAAQTGTLPASIPDAEFWKLTEQLSEPNGSFQSDNLLSNETALSTVAAALAPRVKAGGVYLGVGPEQNFHYIAAIRPRIAFITDVRRGNLHLQLMYKALFELSADRAEFVSRLFTKPRPAGLSAKSTAADLMNAFWDVSTSTQTTYEANLQTLFDHLTKTHGFPLTREDRDGIAYVYHAFYWYGPRISYSSSSGRDAGVGTYGELMMVRDLVSGQERSYLATEESFNFIKTLQSRNLIVPLVGDFAGPKALRAVGAWIRERGATVTAFYLSNVETYLRRNGVWPAFCANVATMPLDEQSTFIRPGMGAVTSTVTVNPATGVTRVTGSYSPNTIGGKPGLEHWFGSMALETKSCF